MRQKLQRSTARRLTGFLALVSIAVGLSACGGSSSGSSVASAEMGSGCAGSEYTVALVPGVTPLSFYDTLARAAEKEAAKYCMTIEYQGASEFSADAQTKVVNALLVKHPDALILAPADPIAMEAPVRQFNDAGIPVFGVDLALGEPSLLKSQVLGNNYQGGEISGQALGKLMKGTGSVAPMATARGIPTLEERYNGFADTMKKENPQVEILPEQFAETSAEAQTIARALLLAHPDLTAFFCATEIQAEGAAAAIEALGRQGEVSVATYDGDPTEVEDLKAGKIQFLAVQQVKKEAQTVVRFVHEYLTGNGASIPKEVKVDTVPVTKENVDDPNIKAILYEPGFGE